MEQGQITLDGYYKEETLIELFQEKKITRCQLICHHSPERRQEFIDFCSERELQQDERAAELFTEEQLRLQEEADI